MSTKQPPSLRNPQAVIGTGRGTVVERAARPAGTGIAACGRCRDCQAERDGQPPGTTEPPCE